MDRRAFLKLPFSATLAATAANGAQVPPFFLDCVVALGYSGPGIINGVPVPKTWHTIGTGFFYGYLYNNDQDINKRTYSNYIVTARHVIDDYNKLRSQVTPPLSLKVRVNPVDTSSIGKEFDLLTEIADPGSGWTNNQNGEDVAVIPANLGTLRDRRFDSIFFTSDNWSLTINKMR